MLKTKRIAHPHANVRCWTYSCFPSRGRFRGCQLKGESESYGSTIIKRQSSKTEREGTLDSGQLRRGADRPSGPNAVWNKQFRPPGNHQQHRGIRKSRKGVRCTCGSDHGRDEVLQREYVAAATSRIPGERTHRAFFHELVGRQKLCRRDREGRPQEDSYCRPLDGDLCCASDGSSPSCRLRDLRGGGLVQRRESACSRQRDE